MRKAKPTRATYTRRYLALLKREVDPAHAEDLFEAATQWASQKHGGRLPAAAAWAFGSKLRELSANAEAAALKAAVPMLASLSFSIEQGIDDEGNSYSCVEGMEIKLKRRDKSLLSLNCNGPDVEWDLDELVEWPDEALCEFIGTAACVEDRDKLAEMAAKKLPSPMDFWGFGETLLESGSTQWTF